MKKTFLTLCIILILGLNSSNVKGEIKEPGMTWDCVWSGTISRKFVNLEEYNYVWKDVPIKWRVLDVKDNEALLLSDEIVSEYHFFETNFEGFYDGPQIDFIWRNSQLRTYMNDVLYNILFSEEERNAIVDSEVTTGYNYKEEKDTTIDKLFILSYEQLVNDYGFYTQESLRCKDYRGNYVNYYTLSNGYRSTNIFSGETAEFAYDVPYNDAIDNAGNLVHTIASGEKGIRAAMWVDLTKYDFQYAGTVSATGDVDEVAYEYPSNPPINLTKVKIKSAKNIKKKSITIKFKKVQDAKKYRIQYATNKKLKKAKIKTSKKTTVKLKKLKLGKTYYIRIQAVNGTKKGKWSKTKKVKVKF